MHTTFHAHDGGGSLMPYQRGHGARQTPPQAADPSDTERFRLVAIRQARTPEGCVGRDWLVYEIAQGSNMITGYRRGELQAITADVERIVVGLNERRIASKGRPGPKPKQTAAAVAQPAPAHAEYGEQS